VGGMRDLIEGGRCGWLCRPSSAQELGSSMRDAIEAGETKRHAMGASGRAHAIADYSLQRMTTGYEQLFRRLLRGEAI
jgi:glycosyltransferase involved in cell wall biosynthesis